jgi:hypothetical protein
MKLSTDPKYPSEYPGYDPSDTEMAVTLAHNSKVFLDGVEIFDCIAADDEAGTCECFKRGENGCGILVDEDGHGVMETRRGHVRIVLPDWFECDRK